MLWVRTGEMLELSLGGREVGRCLPVGHRERKKRLFIRRDGRILQARIKARLAVALKLVKLYLRNKPGSLTPTG